MTYLDLIAEEEILSGDVTGLRGYVTGLSGNVTDLSGDVSGLSGDVTNIPRYGCDYREPLRYILEQLAYENGEIE